MTTSRAWRSLVIIASALVLFGAFCYAIQLREGLGATSLRNPAQGGAAWGLYIAFDVVFTGVSFAGITVAAVARLSRAKALAPLTRIAELLTITSLLAGACTIVVDLGRPIVGLTRLPRLANPSSPFYGTFTLVVAGYLFSSAAYFFLAGRADAARLAQTTSPLQPLYRAWASGWRGTPEERARHELTGFWMSLGILPLLVTAHSTLGFIFGLQSGRPGWFSALQAPAFVVMAGVSGVGALILVALAARRIFRLEIADDGIRWLGNLMWVLALVYIYFLVVEELTAGYAAPAPDRALSHEILLGHFAPWFWIVAASLALVVAIGFTLYVRKRTSVRAIAVAAVFANVAAVVKRVLIVVPSQTRGALLPIERGKYLANFVEIGIIVGLCAGVALAILIFGKYFPLVPSIENEITSPPAREPRRSLATAATIALALGLISVGLVDSFRLFDRTAIDPKIPFSPSLFALGVMMLFSAAIVFEVWPSVGAAPRLPMQEDR